MARRNKSQIEQIYKEKDKTKNVLSTSMSPYIYESSPFMKEFLDRLNQYRMNNYYSVKLVENLYNFTEKQK